ncbi:MAG: HEAT repeat domain-containing protein [Helicobacteraceae bacterium]|jgi:HEAT repeat protein|nr:HEAT repeat domain-containing protein [Helicobacteraceae bacterium]
MTAEAFLSQLNSIAPDKRAAFSQTVLKLGKLAAAEATLAMLEDGDFGVKINALKAIRYFGFDIYEKRLIRLLIDDEPEARVAALKSLASFGKPEHFGLVRAFYDENIDLRPQIIDSLVNFSDQYDAHSFMFGRLDSSNGKIRQCAIDWFDKALERDIFLPWIERIYEESAWSLRLAFEKSFAKRLTRLFDNPRHGYRFKLVWLGERAG